MSSRAASCPSCGGEILFRAGTSIVAVCPQCRAAVSRKGVNLESLGTVAELVPTSSPFRLGMAGKPKRGYRPFRIVGRLQLSTGEGTWDEWYVAFDDGRYGWLAEAQGLFYLLKPMPATEGSVPEFHQLQPAQRLDLRPYGVFTVAERRQAIYSSAEGDLPFAATPGAVFMFADLSGPDGSFATLDYGDDPGLDALFVGTPLALADLGIEGLTAWAERKTAAKAAGLNCPSCGGSLQLKDPQNTVRIACVYCGSLLAAPEGEGGATAQKYEVLLKLQKPAFKPSVPIGSEGTLLGRPYVVLGAIRKLCVVDGTTYSWLEYLLKEKKTEGYHWLVESNGHWTLVEPIPPGAVTVAESSFATYGERRYKHFQTSLAKVGSVLGEFYWEVKKGDKTTADDFVAPPRLLSRELAENEVAASEGVYLPKADVEAGFSLKEPLAEPEGVGANQPWPRAADAPLLLKTAAFLAVAAVVLFVFFSIRAPRKVVYQSRHDLESIPASHPVSTPTPEGAAAGGTAEDARVVVTAPFELTKTTNLRADLSAPTDNTWVAVGADLIDEASGEVRSFQLLSDYYHGYDGGESWSEGTQARSVFLSQVPAGRYVLRIDPEFEEGKRPPYFDLKLTSGVPRVSRLVLLLFLLTLGPIALGISKVRFESRRWAESDHPWSSGSDGGSSSDDD